MQLYGRWAHSAKPVNDRAASGKSAPQPAPQCLAASLPFLHAFPSWCEDMLRQRNQWLQMRECCKLMLVRIRLL